MKATVSYTANVDQELFNVISSLTGIRTEAASGDAQYTFTTTFAGEKLYKYLPQALVLFGKFKRIASEVKEVKKSDEFTTLAKEILQATNMHVCIKEGDKVHIDQFINLAEANQMTC